MSTPSDSRPGPGIRALVWTFALVEAAVIAAALFLR